MAQSPDVRLVTESALALFGGGLPTRVLSLENKNTAQDIAINAAKTDAIADATTKYGGLPAKITAIEPKKCVRLEAGSWVWDTVNGTHYVIPDANGSLVVRVTAIPLPAATPALNW